MADDAGASAVLGGEHVEDGVILVVESDRRGAHDLIVARVCCVWVGREASGLVTLPPARRRYAASANGIHGLRRRGVRDALPPPTRTITPRSRASTRTLLERIHTALLTAGFVQDAPSPDVSLTGTDVMVL